MKEFMWRKEALWAAIVLVVGVGFGLVVGWLVWPVQWTNVLPADLTSSEQQAYMLAVAQAYELNKDAALARQRLSSFDEGVAGAIILEAAQVLEGEGRAIEAQQLRHLASGLALQPGPPVPTASSPIGQPKRRWLTIVLALVPVAAVLIGVLIFLRRRHPRLPSAPVQPEPSPPTWGPRPSTPKTFTAGERPLLSVKAFTASYSLGDDEYKQSFHVDSSTGEPLGECGVKASVAIGEGAPDRVAAFEVWLLCKGDVRATTKVFVSPFACQDKGLRSELVRKGDVIVAQQGSLLLFEAGELTMKAEVLECVYSQDETMGPESYFDHLNVKLTAMTKGR